MENHFVVCKCQSDEHVVRFTYDEEDMWVSVHLHQYRPLWKKIWTRIKYMFGYRSKYGHWDVCMISKKEAKELKKVLEQFIGEEK